MNSASPIAGPAPNLSPAQGETLRLLLNAIVPPDADGRLPGAGDIDAVVRHVARLQGLEAALRACRDTPGRDALERLGDSRLLDRLVLETVTCYYQQDRVLEALGLEARPPHPKGYQREPGDLSLLDPVIARGKIWREAP